MSDHVDLLPGHRRAMQNVGALVAAVGQDAWSAPTPCDGWDVAALLAHMIGQNLGFADAVAHGDAPVASYASRPSTVQAVRADWQRSADLVVHAFEAAAPDDVVRLVEIDPTATVSVQRALAIHLLDTTVHAWDLASALGHDHRPDDEVVDAVHATALRVPAGADARGPGKAFGPARPARPATLDDPWAGTLAALGRVTPWRER